MATEKDIEVISGPYWIGGALISPELPSLSEYETACFQEIKDLRACIQEQLFAQLMGWA